MKNEPRKRPQQARSQRMVDTLLEATARVLAERGFEGATTKEIARVAGVSIGSLYQYFPTKEALVAALVEQQSQADLERIYAATAGTVEAPIAEKLRVGTSAAIALYRKNLPLYRTLLKNLTRVGRVDTMRAVTRKRREGLRALIESRRGQVRAVDPELGAFVLTSAIEWVILSAVLDNSDVLDDPRLVDEIVTLALGYLDPGLKDAKAPSAILPASGDDGPKEHSTRRG
ncbi:Transcriptional regulator, TetR family protein [Minicystis rosea]|nr:Transcriptional regulator, TetR family protein [Minicystis rosea]